MDPEVKRALQRDRTIDIVTTGRKSGQPCKIEIWFLYVAGKYVITGTPGPRGWFANLKANPEFDFCLKESVQATIRAKATPITDREDRHHIFSAPETKWYRDQVESVGELIDKSPLVELTFLD